MTDTTAHVLTESAYKQAARTAESLGATRLSRMLESSGPLLKVAAVSLIASDLVHQYRITLSIALDPRTGNGIAVEAYKLVREQFDAFLKSGALDNELRQTMALELKRADALVIEAGEWTKRTVTATNLAPVPLTNEGAKLLLAWTQRMKAPDVADTVKATFAKFAARIKPSDHAWGSMSELALDRARRVKAQYPSITRTTYASDPVAAELIEGSYTVHGKGELHEHLARNTENVKTSIDAELRGAAHAAGQRGTHWTPILSAGELRLGTEAADGTIGNWKKFADTGVLIGTTRAEETAAAIVGIAGAAKVDGVAQPRSLLEFKAEAFRSRIPDQQQRALSRMVARWAQGKPVYVAVGVADETGAVRTKVFLLQPPDSKAGLSYYGIGTSNAFVAEREALARQGADVKNMTTDVSNEELRALWDELFWTAFASL